LNTNDLVVGFDPTSSAAITGAQLAQMVNGATPSSDRGFVLVTYDNSTGDPTVPNATSATGVVALQRYLWLRISTNSISVYAWNAGGSTSSYASTVSPFNVTNLLNWQPITVSGIGNGSITNAMLQSGSVTADKISTAGIPGSLLTGTVPASWVTSSQGDGLLMTSSSPLYGAITGFVNATMFGKQVVSGSSVSGAGNITDSSIYGMQIAYGAITTVQLLAGYTNAYATTYPYNNQKCAVDPGANITVPDKSILGIPAIGNYAQGGGQTVAPGDILVVGSDSAGNPAGYVTSRRAILTQPEPVTQTYQQVPAVAANGIVYGLVNANTIGRLVQTVGASYAAPQQQAASKAMLTDTVAGLTIANQAKSLIGDIALPSSVNGHFVEIQATVPMFIASGTPGWAGLYDNNAAAFIAWGRLTMAGAGNSQVRLSYCGVLAGTFGTSVNRAYSIYFGSTSAVAASCVLSAYSEGMTVVIHETL
jgi:hypothetical protein